MVSDRDQDGVPDARLGGVGRTAAQQQKGNVAEVPPGHEFLHGMTADQDAILLERGHRRAPGLHRRSLPLFRDQEILHHAFLLQTAELPRRARKLFAEDLGIVRTKGGTRPADPSRRPGEMRNHGVHRRDAICWTRDLDDYAPRLHMWVSEELDDVIDGSRPPPPLPEAA